MSTCKHFFTQEARNRPPTISHSGTAHSCKISSAPTGQENRQICMNKPHSWSKSPGRTSHLISKAKNTHFIQARRLQIHVAQILFIVIHFRLVYTSVFQKGPNNKPRKLETHSAAFWSIISRAVIFNLWPYQTIKGRKILQRDDIINMLMSTDVTGADFSSFLHWGQRRYIFIHICACDISPTAEHLAQSAENNTYALAFS